MLSTRDIKRKIRTVRNIQQITKAMKTVSSIKLRKAEGRIKAAQPYADALRDMVGRLGSTDYAHPLLARRDVQRTGVVVISADKGLAGGYNTNVIREGANLVRLSGEVRTVTIGRKVTDSFRRQGFVLESFISPLGNDPEFRTIAGLADHIGELYTQEAWDRVDLVYTQFGSGVTTVQLLPIEPPAGEDTYGDFIYEPNAGAILEQILPRYLRTTLYTAVLSAIAAEHSARVAAMSLATDNADDLIGSLTLDYNKSRQAAITTELGDIVGAAEALR